jgi:hypothetical protein
MKNLVASCFVSYISGSTLESLLSAITESANKIKLPEKSSISYYELYPIDDEVLLNIHYTMDIVEKEGPTTTPFVAACRRRMYEKLHKEFGKEGNNALYLTQKEKSSLY